MNKNFSQIAYEAYADSLNWVFYVGQDDFGPPLPMRQWEALEERYQNAWNEATLAILNRKDLDKTSETEGIEDENSTTE